jgi:sterol desaturase/sphingolipid hydroxylase (fatty acid hydroxylase superfamily)
MIEYVLYTILHSELSYLFYGFLVIAFGGYILLAGGSFLYFYIFKKSEWMRAKIQEDIPTSANIWYEIKWSLSSTFIWIVFAIGIIVGIDQGIFKLYFDISEFGRLYFVLSIILLVLLHDTYFYWTHRFMHSSYTIFKLFHKTHHDSKNPTPFAIHAFGPLEAILYAAFIPLALFILPVHLYALLAWFLIETIVNVMGHLGHELFPLKMFRGGVGKWINSPTHHNLHHQESRYGFGHYFNFWDRIMGTNHKNYDEILNREQ